MVKISWSNRVVKFDGQNLMVKFDVQAVMAKFDGQIQKWPLMALPLPESLYRVCPSCQQMEMNHREGCGSHVSGQMMQQPTAVLLVDRLASIVTYVALLSCDPLKLMSTS